MSGLVKTKNCVECELRLRVIDRLIAIIVGRLGRQWFSAANAGPTMRVFSAGTGV